MNFIPKPGEKNPNAKLTEKQVKEIRLIASRKYGKINKFGNVDHTWLGKKFGVSARTISSILTGMSWSNKDMVHSRWDY